MIDVCDGLTTFGQAFGAVHIHQKDHSHNPKRHGAVLQTMSDRQSSYRGDIQGGHVDSIPLPQPSGVWRVNAGGLPLALHCNASFPDKLIVKKHLKPLPLLELRLKAVYDTRSNTFAGSCSCKDTLLGGRIQLDTEAQTIAYKKRFALADAAALAITGSVSYTGATPPAARVELYFHQGHAILHRDRWQLKHTALLGDSVGVQLKAAVRMPMPAARYEMSQGGPRLQANEVEVFLDEANVVLKL